jgi:beta-galactosidase
MTRTGVVSTESAAARAALGSLLRREASPTWELPELPSLNRLPPAAAVQREPRLLRSLDGTWRFRLAHDPDEAVERADSGTPVEVPGLWTMQGFEPPHYTNERMPFPEPPPRTPRHNPTGVYWRGFEIPRAWAGRRIVVGFAGVEGMLALAVNGHAVGFSKDARTPAEFDVTELVEIGRPNEVVACVVRWSDASFLEDQDQWWHAGIARGVYAYAGSIADVRATIALDASYRDGAVHVDAPGAESASLTDAAGHTLAAGDLPASLEVAAPRLWSAESPSLYTLRVAAADEAVTCRIGFRAVEIRDRHLLVNGRPVRITA